MRKRVGAILVAPLLLILAANAVLAAGRTAPPAPIGVTATAGNKQVTLNWSSSSGATSYEVFRATASGSEGSKPVKTGVTGTSFVNTGLTDGVTYFYKIAAVNKTGTSKLSVEVSAKPVAPPPPAPTNLTAAAGDDQVTLSWTAVNATGVTYNVFRGTTAGGEGATPIKTGLAGSMLIDTSVTNGTMYFFKVTALVNGVSSASSNEASATPAGPPPLPAPANLTAVPGDEQVSLSWAAVNAAGVSYNIFRGTSAGVEGATPIKTGLTSTAFVDVGLPNGAPFFYKVGATANGVTSALSNEANGTPVGTSPPAGGLPALPSMANVHAEVSGQTVSITFDPFDGAKDYRAYLLPANSDIILNIDGTLAGVRNALYRCAGLRAVGPINVDHDPEGLNNGFGSGDNSFVHTQTSGYQPFLLSYTRPASEITLGYVFNTQLTNTAPVYAVGSPADNDDVYGVGSRMKETRNKLYTQDPATYQAKLAEGWRDDGIAFYAPTSISGCGTGKLVPVFEEEATDPGFSLLYRYYYSAAGEVAAWSQLAPGTISWANVPPPSQPFSVCSVQTANAFPLMRVNYIFPTNRNSHDELAVGQSRFDLARCQGTTTGSCADVNHSLWSIQYTGVTAGTQIVVEALDSGCPYPGGLYGPSFFKGGTDPFGGAFTPLMDPIYPLSKIQSLSSIGEAYVNGQYDGNPTPHPVARTIVNVAPQARPAMDFSSDFVNKPEVFTEKLHMDGSADCGLDEAFPQGLQTVFPSAPPGCQTSHRLTSPTYDSILFSQDSYMGAIGIVQGQLMTSGGNTQISPINGPRATISATDDNDFLHVALEVNAFTTDRRYPQIAISDHGLFQEAAWYVMEAPPDTATGVPFPDGDQQNTVFLGAMMAGGPLMELEVCNNRGWRVNAHCPYFLLERSGASLVSGAHREGNNIHQDINGTMQEDTPVRWDLYVSKDRVYYYANSKPYGCVRTLNMAGVLAGDVTPHIPTGNVVVAFGDRIYHPQAETGELCATNSFLCKHSGVETIRRYNYFGIVVTRESRSTALGYSLWATTQLGTKGSILATPLFSIPNKTEARRPRNNNQRV
ncbi:MAG: fibronectin type III domain-containing protein [Blastocatellia bacterium]